MKKTTKKKIYEKYFVQPYLKRTYFQEKESDSDKTKNQFDMSKFDELQKVIDDAKEDLKRPLNSVDPKEVWSLIFGKIKSAVDNIIQSEGLNVTSSSAAPPMEFENDLPAGNGQAAMNSLDFDTDTNEPEQENNDGDQNPPMENQQADDIDDGKKFSEELENDLSALFGGKPKNNNNDAATQAESIAKLRAELFKAIKPLDWEDLKKFSLKETSGTGQEANAQFYLAGMIKGAIQNDNNNPKIKQIIQSASKIFQKLQNNGFSDQTVLEAIRQANIVISDEFYRKNKIQIAPNVLKSIKSFAAKAKDDAANNAVSEMEQNPTIQNIAKACYLVAVPINTGKSNTNQWGGKEERWSRNRYRRRI